MKFLHNLVLALALGAGPAMADAAGDLVFAERGPWQLGAGGVEWVMTQEGPAVPGFVAVQNGKLLLEQVIDPSDGAPVLQLSEDSARVTRKIGPFPISAGDPTLVFFLESTSRDMAAMTGGSPFYIRNRLKDALFRGGKVLEQDGFQVAEFTPFADDPNAERMGAFKDLTLRFYLKDPSQPIARMIAQTSGGQPPYRSELVMK
jgi:hypothetical protein